MAQEHAQAQHVTLHERSESEYSRGAAGSNRRDASGKFTRPSIWLSLSGGGFRAGIFHYGCLKRLRELGLLGHVYAFSAASGGAIVAALLHAHCKGPASGTDGQAKLEDYDWELFERGFLSLVRRGVFGPMMLLLVVYALYFLGAVLFGEFWLLIRPYAQFSGWKGTPEVLWVAARALAIAIFLAGLVLHACLAKMLMNEGAHRPAETAVPTAPLKSSDTQAGWEHGSVARLVRMLLLSAYLRRQILNLRAFHGTLLKQIHTQPKLFLTAVDLNAGRETIFTAGLFADLSERGCRCLWEQRADGDENTAGNVELAQAVSASSAFWPFFHPEAIRNERGVIGVFIDGGMLDYYALNVPRAFGVRIDGRGDGQDGGRQPSFREEISFVLGLDGCKAATVKTKTHWSRGASMFRLKAVMVDQNYDAVELFAREFDRDLGIRSAIAGLEFGFPQGNPLHDTQLNRYLARVRTHLDSFSREETAALAYCGYLQMDRAIAEGLPLSEYAGARATPPAAFEEILPAYCGPWKSSVAALRKHLRYSNRRQLLLRMCGRMFGV